jgi:hypothetical protein
MNNAITDGGIYHNGRTYAEHCAWLDSLVGDEYLIVYTPIGHLYSLATISHFKFILFNFKMTAHERMKTLEVIAMCTHGLVTEEAVAAIEPCCETGRKMFQELNSLPMEKRTQAFHDGDVFRLLARLNPSLLAALRLCKFNQTIPEEPRSRASANLTQPTIN